MRLAVLVVVFVLDVHVRAADLLAADDHRLVTTFRQARVSLRRGALAAPAGERLRLVRGRLYAEGAITIATPFGELACAGAACAGFVDRTDGDVTLAAVSDGWRVTPRGAPGPLGVDAGTRVSIGAAGRDGRAGLEPPQSLPWAPLVRDWAELFPGDAAAFVARVRAFRPHWARAVSTLSDDQRSRVVAAVDADRRAAERRARSQAAAAAEDAELRRLFRAKNFVED